MSDKKPLNPFEGSPLFTPSTENTPQRQRASYDRSHVPFDQRYQRQTIYVEVGLAPQLETLYDLLPGNKKTILNDILRRFVEENRELLAQHPDRVEEYTRELRHKKGLD